MNPVLEVLESRRLLSSAGSLDPTFGTAGTTNLHIAIRSNTPLDMIALPGGKALILGSFFDNLDGGLYPDGPYIAVVRTLPDGTLDPTFGQNGVARLGYTVTANSIALTADGHIVVAARTLSTASITSLVDLVIERLTPDGVLDTSFGNGGMVRTDVAGRDDVGTKVLMQPDGKIIVAGYDQRPFLPGVLQLPDVFVVRYDAAGLLDPTFGTGGKVVLGVPGYQAAEAKSAALEGDGKIVVVGNVVRKEDDGFMVRGDPPQYLAMRFNPDGSLDHSFAGGGMRVLPNTGTANDVWVAPGGKIYAGGGTQAGDFSLLAISRNGSLDRSFGTRGITTTGFEKLTGARPGNDSAQRVIPQRDGKFVLVGAAASMGIGLARFKANGRLDNMFGSRGIVLTPGSATSFVTAAMQEDDRLLAAANSGMDILLTRYVAYTGGIAGTVQEIPTVMSPPVGPLANWTMYLDLNRNGRRDAREPTAMTDSSGKYTFVNLAPGVYRVAQVFPAGWGPTPHTPAAKSVRAVAGAVQQPIDFACARRIIPRRRTDPLGRRTQP